MSNEVPSKGYPQRAQPLPLALEEVTARWLTETLQLQYPQAAVESFDILETVPGHTSKLRLRLQLNSAAVAAGIPTQVCLKANWSGSPLSSPVCINEARFYKELASRLPIPTPACYFADWDDGESAKQGLVIMEDLVASGGSFTNSAYPLDVNGMAKSLEGLARTHGVSWAHPELSRHAWLQTAMAPETVTDDYWGMMEETYAAHNRMPERVAMFPRWMASNPNVLRGVFRQLCARENALATPRCLIHGDAHLGNTYLRTSGERIWIDWQIVRKGRPWRDVAYFMVGSITIEDRRKSERELLRHYLDSLAGYGVKIGFDEAWDDYRRMIIWGLVAWQSNINPREVTLPPLERFCRAADDLETHTLFDMKAAASA